MKILVKPVILLIALTTIVSFSGCLRPITPGNASSETVSVAPVLTDVPETTDPITETSENVATEPVTTDETEPAVTTEEIEEQPIIAGDWMWREGYGMFDEGYHVPLEIYSNVYSPSSIADLYIIYSIYDQQDLPSNEQQYAREQKENNPEIRNLPNLYLIIKHLDVDKSEFIKWNNYNKKLNEEEGCDQATYTDDQIEYLFGDYGIDETIEHLKAPWAYYYRGRLYTIFNIFQIENEKLIAEMYSKGNLEEYIQNMKELLNGDIVKYFPEGTYEIGDEERVILNMISDFETLPLKEFQSKHALEYGIGFDWENYVPEELRP